MTLDLEGRLPEPWATREAWQRLFEAAKTFRQAEPWTWMREDRMFGVEDPETGAVHFCSITGEMGEHCALITYLGEEGLGSYLQFIAEQLQIKSALHDRSVGLMLLETPQLQAIFENRRQIDRVDYDLIRALGHRFRGRNAWPMFRRFRPGRLPWYLTGPEVRLTTLLLEQALEVSHEAESPGFVASALGELASYYGETPGQIKAPVRFWDGEAWRIEIRELEPLYVGYSHEVDAEALTELRRSLPQRAFAMQVDLTLMLGSAVEEGEDPPYLAYYLLLVDADSGFVYGHDVLLARPDLATLLSDTSNAVLAHLQRLGVRPTEIQVVSERLYDLLALPTGYLGIELNLYEDLPALGEAARSLEQFLEGGLP